MDCRKVRELLLTDFLDDEAKGRVRAGLAAHLSGCAECRAFARSIQETVSGPLRRLDNVEPPAVIWQNIRDAILDQQREPAPSWLKRLRSALAESFLVRRPQYALATALSAAIVVVLFLQSPLYRQVAARDYIRQQALYLASSQTAAVAEMEAELGMGTAIEKFLF